MHVIVWEFIVAEDSRADFESAYGPDGDWAMLFARATGYGGSELLRDEGLEARYLTVDRWESRARFDDFRFQFGGDYEDLDRRLAGLAERETRLGDFAIVS